MAINTSTPTYRFILDPSGLNEDLTDRIISMTPVTVRSEVDEIGDIGQVSIVLDDSDGAMKTHFDGTVLYNMDGVIKFKSDTGATEINAFVGKITSPIDWNESQRRLSLALISKVDSDLVTVLTDPELENDICPRPVPPIAFGTVLGVKAVSKNCIPDSITMEPIYSRSTGKTTPVPPPATIVSKDVFEISNPDAFPSGDITVSIDNVLFEGNVDTVTSEFSCIAFGFNKTYPTIPVVNDREQPTDDNDYNNAAVFWCSDSSGVLAGKYMVLEFDQDYYYFAEGTGAEFERLEADSTLYNGHETGRRKVFVRCSQQNGNKVILEHPVIDDLGRPVLLSNDNNAQVIDVKGQYDLGNDLDWTGPLQYTYPPRWEIPPGTQIILVSDSQEFLFNGVETDEFYGLYGYKNGQFQVVPSSMYTVDLVESKITLGTALRYGNEWEFGKYYASFKSSIASDGNVVDVLEYIINNYTNLTIDTTSFNYVKARPSVTNYPCGFAIFDTPDAIDLMQRICWEARLGMSIRNNIVYLRDLTEDFSTATPSGSMTTSNTEHDSLNMQITDVKDVYTHIHGTWKPDYFPFTVELRVYRSNQLTNFDKYVLDHFFMIYNIRECVVASVEWWMERYSNIWQLLDVGTFYENVEVKPFDILDITLPDFTAATEGLIMSNNTNFTEDSSEVVVWLPTSPSGGDPFPTLADAPTSVGFSAIDSSYTSFLQQPYVLGTLPGIMKKNRLRTLTEQVRYGYASTLNQENRTIQVKVTEVNDKWAMGDMVVTGDNNTAAVATDDVAEIDKDYTGIKFNLNGRKVEVGQVVTIILSPKTMSTIATVVTP